MTAQRPLGTPLNKSHPLSKGLEGFWPFSEGGGNRLINALGSSTKDGINNGATWATWNKGNCLNFVRTSSQFISATIPFDVQIIKPLTLSAWINTVNTNFLSIMADWNISVTAGWEFTISEFNAGKIGILFTSSGGINYFGRRGSTNVNDGTWKHVVATFDGSGVNTGINLYVNGILETPTNITAGTGNPGAMVNTNFRIGCRMLTGANNQFYDGKMALPMVWSRALSQTEVQQLYADNYCMFLKKKI